MNDLAREGNNDLTLQDGGVVLALVEEAVRFDARGLLHLHRKTVDD